MKNTYLKRLCEESKHSLVGRRGNPISPLRHSEERIVRRENLILKNILIEKEIKNEILTASKSEASG